MGGCRVARASSHAAFADFLVAILCTSARRSANDLITQQRGDLAYDMFPARLRTARKLFAMAFARPFSCACIRFDVKGTDRVQRKRAFAPQVSNGEFLQAIQHFLQLSHFDVCDAGEVIEECLGGCAAADERLQHFNLPRCFRLRRHVPTATQGKGGRTRLAFEPGLHMCYHDV